VTAIGRLFREIRGELSFRELARAMEVGHAKFCKIEGGKRIPSVRLVRSLASRAGLNARQLNVLLACRKRDVCPDLAQLCWRHGCGATLKIADALMEELGCSAAVAFVEAGAALCAAERQLSADKVDRDARQLDLLGV
jgi:transcriptional regulator with XRE-family HTH domain